MSSSFFTIDSGFFGQTRKVLAGSKVMIFYFFKSECFVLHFARNGFQFVIVLSTISDSFTCFHFFDNWCNISLQVNDIIDPKRF